MTNEYKRNLHADLALCEAATPGPWLMYGGKFGETNVYYPPYDNHDEVVSDIDADRRYDAKFIAESRQGWPESIRRAIAAEAEVERLTAFIESESECAVDLVAENERLRESERWLKALVSALDDGRIAQTRLSSGTDFVIHCAREHIRSLGPQDAVTGEEEVAKMRSVLAQIAEYGGTDMRGSTCAQVAKEALDYGTR